MARVVLKHITKKYDDVLAVDDISLEIQDKEFVVLVGPSGCGKSTTLRMIAGLEEITAGELYIGDRLVNDVAPKDRNIAMVFQNYALYPHMDVYANMAFGLKLRRTPKPEIEARVREAAQVLGIQEFLSRKPKQLSGGQRQRVAVGRAIVRHPEVFLFDEPLSNLDAKLRVQMRTELVKLHDRLSATMIYVTHDQIEAMTMGDRIVIMCDGVIQQVGQPLEVYERPANTFVAGFIGSPSMNFFSGRLLSRTGGLVVDLGKGLVVPLPADRRDRYAPHVGREVLLGIRPENVCDRNDGNPSRVPVPSTVTVYEPLGNEVILELAAGDHAFHARVDPHTPARPHEPITAYFDMARAHLFDAKTEQVL